jgi:hypothetical protein
MSQWWQRIVAKMSQWWQCIDADMSRQWQRILPSNLPLKECAMFAALSLSVSMKRRLSLFSFRRQTDE